MLKKVEMFIRKGCSNYIHLVYVIMFPTIVQPKALHILNICIATYNVFRLYVFYQCVNVSLRVDLHLNV